MSYLDKTFCAFPGCQNQCGRKMTALEKENLTRSRAQYVSYGYFCQQENDIVKRLKSVVNKDIPS